MAKKKINTKYMTTLPNFPVRPYALVAKASLDDRTYSFVAPNDLKYNLKANALGFLSVAGVGLATIVLSIDFAVGIQKSISIMTERSPWLTWGTLDLIIIAVILWLLSLTLAHRNFLLFNRQNGTLQIPLSNFSSKKVTVPFSECEGRLLRITGRYGMTEHRLALMCPRINKTAIIFGPSHEPDIALGFWSFIAQYMNKDGNLPDVPDLEQYSPRERGVGTWEEWKQLRESRSFIDPFEEWKRSQGR